MMLTTWLLACYAIAAIGLGISLVQFYFRHEAEIREPATSTITLLAIACGLTAPLLLLLHVAWAFPGVRSAIRDRWF